MRLRYDIFCKVVDNFGDIGVCWRLARQLAARHDCGPVRLWVDDLISFRRIAPQVDPKAPQQQISGMTVLHWQEGKESGGASEQTGSANTQTAPAAAAAFPPPADVVIEAFACTLPEAYLAAMSPQQLWLNLEYLSAEDWVESCHALPSMQGGGLRKFFFFPGFTDKTGGLLREHDLVAQRDRWQADSEQRNSLLARVGVDAQWRERLNEGAALVYVYCYPQAPLAALLQALASGQRDTLVLLPEGIWPGELPSVQGRLNGKGSRDAEVQIHTLPFVDQDDFDRLLWSCDLNVVRGEDSLVRAIWAARPMIWQPYIQEEEAHLVKLDAWLQRAAYPDPVKHLMRAWNTGDAEKVESELRSLLKAPAFRDWQLAARQWSDTLASETDLAQRLVDFCTDHHRTR